MTVSELKAKLSDAGVFAARCLFACLAVWMLLLGPNAFLPPILNWVGAPGMGLVAYAGLPLSYALTSLLLKRRGVAKERRQRVAWNAVGFWCLTVTVLTLMGYVDGGGFTTAAMSW